jgi:hypothetical protein
MRTVEVTAGEISARAGSVIPVDAVLEGALLVLFMTTLLICCSCRAARHAKVRERARQNNLAIATARDAPEDDGDEHELEKHSHGRGPTPGDSDLDDDLYTAKSHAPASAVQYHSKV